ncbi:MAG: aldehyde dehydrogenase, partial [Eubacterium sp.]|nr:aldehyde dehydrogenase [Eubacterium sp.]
MKMIINGKSVPSSNGIELDVYNPYSGEVVDTVPSASKEDIDLAAECAVKAQREWRKVPVHKRVELANKFLAIVRENKEELAQLLTAESGKPIRQSRIEINNIFISWKAFCEKAKHLYGSVIPAGQEQNHDGDIVFTTREPIGVVACVIPFNFPCNLFNQKVAPAILSGNAAIVKPSMENPLTVGKLVEYLNEAGIPAGVVQYVTGKGSEIGSFISENPKIDALTLTGSTAVGVQVAKSAASSLKTVALELGGNDAFVVLEDATLEQAVNEAVKTRYFNAGQICCAPKRFIIHKSLYKEFLNRCVEEASKFVIGAPTDENTDIGTLISEAAAEEVERQINLTVEQGAKLICGGDRNGAVMSFCILADVPYDADVMHDMEVFGPVMACTSFETEEEAIALANDTKYGLGASVFTNDMKKAVKFSSEFQAGAVVINGSSYFR